MRPYLVRTRAATAAGRGGPMVTYVAVFHTEAEAIEAVEKVIPDGWVVVDAVGVSIPSFGGRRQFKPGTVEEL